jgi:hypothetical protein
MYLDVEEVSASDRQILQVPGTEKVLGSYTLCKEPKLNS